MKALFKAVLIAAVFFTPFFASEKVYSAGKDLDYRIDDATDVFNEIMKMPDKAIPADLLKNCAGIAIFPSVIKGGFFIGARYGRGVILAKDEKTHNWSAPAFCSIGGLSYGLQIGGQAIDLVLVIGNTRGLKSLLRGKVSLGGDMAVSAGPSGRNAEASTDIALKTGILSYSRSRGLFAGMSFKGAMITQNAAENESYYKEKLTSEDILFGAKVNPGEKAKKLIRVIEGYSR